MKLHTHPVGSLSVVIMDQHRGIHHHRAATPAGLLKWMAEQDPDFDSNSLFCLTRDEWDQVWAELDVHGTVHVETEFDCDLVITRHLR
jgi:hypothetical protein